MKSCIASIMNLVLSLVICVVGNAFGMEKEKFVGASKLTEQAQQIYRDLLGKVKKLDGYDDIYVGAGYSAAGEPIFFGMEKLDDQSEQIWRDYVNALENLAPKLLELNHSCGRQEYRKELERKKDLYHIKLMNMMCANQKKLSAVLAGSISGTTGFNEILFRRENGDFAELFNEMLAGQINKNVGSLIYIAYASSQSITGPFRPKKKLGDFPTLEDFEQAYPNIIMSVGVDMKLKTPRTEHRGIFKNPFYDIQGTYKNIGLKFHAWAVSVEERIFHKAYMTLYPTPETAALLHRAVKPGEMYIGVDKESCSEGFVGLGGMCAGIDKELYPEELTRKFPSINHELIGIQTSCNHMREVAHIFDLNVLSKYYTETSEKK